MPDFFLLFDADGELSKAVTPGKLYGLDNSSSAADTYNTNNNPNIIEIGRDILHKNNNYLLKS